MNLDEFAFFNHQLAGMLKSGIPLEAALRLVCAEMRRQRWRWKQMRQAA
jgi:type II secretory pathway component PulF